MKKSVFIYEKHYLYIEKRLFLCIFLQSGFFFDEVYNRNCLEGFMQLDFRIDWGYQYLYSRRHYHPFFEWDGHLECSDGNICNIWQLEYPVLWYGPGHSAKETLLSGNSWKNRTRRGLSGIRVVADVTENTVFKLVTRSGSWEFSAAQIIDDGRIVFPVGAKYLNCNVIVTRTGYLWFRPAPKAGQQVFEASEIAEAGNLPLRNWARMTSAWVEPGGKFSVPLEIVSRGFDYEETLIHMVAMAAPPGGYTPEKEVQFHDEYTVNIYCDGEKIGEKTHFYRQHDGVMQMLEDVWVRVQMKPGKHVVTLENTHPEGYLLFNRLIFQDCGYNHLQLSLPNWAIAGEKIIGKVFAVKPEKVTVAYPGGRVELNAVQGWNEFEFVLAEAGKDVQLSANGVNGVIPEVYALGSEAIPVTVGYDMTVVPHDDNGFMDWLLDYTWRTQLGNLVVFRSFLYQKDCFKPRPVDGKLLYKWADFCRKHGIWVEAATDFDDGNLIKGAGELIHSVGRHEYPGAVYARDPQEPYASADMREASEKFMEYLKIEIDRSHNAGGKCAFGDASGGHRYCYLAGADFMRTETMVPHTMHLCSQARPAAEALGSGEWGVHIAIHHPMQPFYESHLGLYYLSIMQPWMMGANMIYEEDSLFVLFKEERQTWDDLLTKGKRDMTRDFFKFVKTHPRSGKCVRNIAFLEGRYAAPFNGFICDVEQTPDYSVWGLFGNNAPEWGHKQPEKCRQVLDVLMPGANTQPLRQQYDKRRFFFSGNPYGDFDEVPVEANAEYFNQYKLLLNLGWNTAIAEDVEKLTAYVKQGGILLTGIPQFSTHVKRDFLRDFNDLALWNNGDLSSIAGIRVKGRGTKYSGQWNCAWRETLPEVGLSAAPNDDVNEDDTGFAADIELAGAEVVMFDASTAQPLLVRYKLGEGWVYTLTVWAYPGHEKFQKLSATVVASLANEVKGDYFVTDPSKEIFWTQWQNVNDNSDSLLMLVNTDWTTRGNVKKVAVNAKNWSFDLDVAERSIAYVRIYGDKALVCGSDLHFQSSQTGKLIAYGSGQCVCSVYFASGKEEERVLDFGNSTEMEIKL